MKTIKFNIAILALTFLMLGGCAKLEVENLNAPDYATAVSSPSDIRGITGGLIRTWFMATHEFDGPALGFWVAGDAGTCSWGNAGMRVLSNQPRNTFNNNPTYEDAQITEDYYNSMNSLLSQANDVLVKLEKEGMEVVTGGVNETAMIKAVAYFTQGVSLGYLGLVYDKGFIVTHETDIQSGVEVSPFSDVIDEALKSLDKAIALSNANTFTLPPSWVPSATSLTNVNFAKLANSFAARILAYSPRNKAQNDALSWQKVFDYANNGLDYDFAPIADDITWYSLYHTYANFSGWGQVDMRVVNLMDPRMPAQWPGANGFDVLPPAITGLNDPNIFDQRIVTDYENLTFCGFRPERGYYHFSNYRFSRRDEYLSTWVTPMPDFYKAENDMLKAEALLYLNRLGEARTVINNGTRVTRGGLPPVAEDAQAIANAIFHERNVELMCSGFGIEFFTMRKANKLQPGTFLHLPIPGSQLQVIGIPYYTFGGTVGTPGEDVSNGGWF